MKLLYSAFLSLSLVLAAVGCSQRKPAIPAPTFEYGERRDTLMLEVRAAFMASMNALNNGNLNDSSTFNSFRSFYDSTFVVFGKPGDPPVAGTVVIDTLRQYARQHKPQLFLSLDRIEVSQDLAYILYHYRETATDRESGRVVLDGNRSACMVLKRDANGDWKCVALTWS